MKKSENFEFMLPENSDNSSLDYFNENFKIIDKILKQALNLATPIVPNMINIKNINDGENITTIISCKGMRYGGRNYSFSQLSFEKGLLNSNSTYYIKATEVQNPNSEQIGVLSAKLAVVEYDGDLENISDSFILASFSTDLDALYLDDSLSYFPSSYVDDLFNQYKEELKNNVASIQRIIEDEESNVKVSDVIIPIGLPKNDKTNKTLTFPNFVFNGEYNVLSNSTISYSSFEDGDTYNVVVNSGNIELAEYDPIILGGSENYCRIRYFAEDNSFAYYFYCNSVFTEGIGVELMKKADKSEVEELKDGMMETKSQPQHINSWVDWISASTPKIRVSCYIKGVYNDSKYWLISDNLLSKDGAHRVYLNRNGDDWVLSENRLTTAYDTIPVCYYVVKDGKVVDFVKFDSENLIENYFNPIKEAIANNKSAIETNTADIEKLETDKESLFDLLIKNNIQGRPIILQEHSKLPLQNLRFYGKSVQDGTPTVDEPVSISSTSLKTVNVYGGNVIDISKLPSASTSNVQVDVNGDEITFTALKRGTYRQVEYKIKDVNLFKDKIYAEFNNVDNPNNFNRSFIFRCYDKSGTQLINKTFPRNTITSITVPKETSYITIIICMNMGEIANVGDTVTISNLVISPVACKYERYKSPTTTTLTNSVTLRGLPVTSGGNITIDDQQYLSDYIDVKSGKLIRNVGIIESYNGEEITTDYLSTTGELSTGATVLYALQNSIEEDLQAEDVKKLQAIQPYYPNSIITSNAEMAIYYIADTKKYIDNQYSKLATAITALGGTI